MQLKRCFFFMENLSASFTQDEIHKISSIFHEVIIITEDKTDYSFPDNVQNHIVKDITRKDKIVTFLNFFWKMQMILFLDLFSKGSSFSYFRQYRIRRGYLMKYLSISGSLESRFTFSENDVLYSFFTFNNAILPVLISKKYKCQFITCTHGRDLYENLEPDTMKLPFRKYIYATANVILSVSNKGKDYLLNRYPQYSNKINVYYLGTKKLGVRMNNKVEDGKIVIVSCANIMTSNIKRIDLIPPLLVELFKHTNKQIEWIHFGNYNFEVNKLLAVALENIELKKNDQIKITLKGPTKNSEILKFYENHPVSMLLSVSSSEGLPFSMMEASSFGIPIVCTDVGGCKEISNQDLLLPDVFSNSDFITVYDRLNQNEDQYRKYASNLWEKSFNFEKSSENLQVFFQLRRNI